MDLMHPAQIISFSLHLFCLLIRLIFPFGGSWQRRQRGGVENVNLKVIWSETKLLISRAEYREL